jgi:hypothetical protein
MPREENIAETGKQRSLRVPLDHYYRRAWPNPLISRKFWLAAIVCLPALAYLTYLFLPLPGSRAQLSPGPLAEPHASWNDDCAKCHQDFQPLRPDAMNLVGWLQGKAQRRQSLDDACIKCHDAPIHHASAKNENVPSCAACHQDHRGLGADIVRADDNMCLSCHRDLNSHRNGESRLDPAVASFDAFRVAAGSARRSHPQFRSLKPDADDPGNIKFNHWLHLQPGIAAKGVERGKKLDLNGANGVKSRLKKSPELDQNQFDKKYINADGLVQLDCAACHQSDRDDAYKQPITFAQHCKSCHPQTWSFGAEGPEVEVPHGLMPTRLAAVLDGLVLAASVRESNDSPVTADEPKSEPLIPGRTLGNNLAQKIRRDLGGQRKAAADAIAPKCQLCHEISKSQSESAADFPDYLPSKIPQTWLKHAKFDHRAHGHVECRYCHAKAFEYQDHDAPQSVSGAAGSEPGPAPTPARDREQVMIGHLKDGSKTEFENVLETCAKCHAPRSANAGGARFDCAACHNYHGNDHSLPLPKEEGQSKAASLRSFPGSPLGTHYRDAPASVTLPNTPTIRLASFQPPPTSTPAFTGVSTCTSTGCHGAINEKSSVREDSTAWQTSFTTWASIDPHSEAFNVLWTVRGREMTRLLEQSADPLTDRQHLQTLEQRCLGCHATPPPERSTSAAHFALGVQCESCHGPAGQWLHAHYQAGFSHETPGFINTKDLNQRAETCLKCHVGPSNATGSPQAVDHDLIAAGHPRLSFEFRSYFESLPAHWNRKRDVSQHADGFHFQSWLAGHTKAAAWREEHHVDPTVDFAQLECAICHHQLDPEKRRLDHRLRSLPAAKSSVEFPPANKTVSASERLALARQLLIAGDKNNSWDDALRGYLALRAITADAPFNSMADWNSQLGKLGEYLARDCFPAKIRNERTPSPYDSPGEFNAAIWNELIVPIVEILRRLESTTQEQKNT